MTNAEEKLFSTLAAQYALCGHALVRGRADQSAAFYAVRWGWTKPLASLDAAFRFLREIGGAR